MATESKFIDVRVKPGKVGLYGGRRWKEGQEVRIDVADCPCWKDWGVRVGTDEEVAAKKALAEKIEATTGAGKKVALSSFAKNAQPDDPTHERK